MDTQPIQGTPAVILTCADCGLLGEIAGTRFVHPDLPYDALCTACWDFNWRFLDRTHLYPLCEASRTDENGVLWLRRTCPRCNGEGKVGGFRGTCFRCWGWRWTYVSPRNVNQVMKASATFQVNRIPRSQQ